MNRLLLFACLFISLPIFSQITTNELPMSVRRGIIEECVDSAKTEKIICLPVPDMKEILYEDSVNSYKHILTVSPIDTVYDVLRQDFTVQRTNQ